MQKNRDGYIRVRASSTEEARRIIGAPKDAPIAIACLRTALLVVTGVLGSMRLEKARRTPAVRRRGFLIAMTRKGTSRDPAHHLFQLGQARPVQE